jgi:pimeloyl-ACP methyl ester carboxylesterase
MVPAKVLIRASAGARPVAAVVLLLAGLALSHSHPAGAAPPRLQPATCSEIVHMSDRANLECGFLFVAENRANASSREIGIPYMRARSSAASPARDVVLMLAGGPGVRNMQPDYALEHPAWAATRDVIWFEQRGTDLTRPALNCEEYVEAGRQAARGRISPTTLARARIAAARKCVERARADGADLRGYNSVEMAADIEDLRRLLNISQLNLYGVSYGARIATIYARSFPSTTRALILNTPLPVEADYDSYASAGLKRTLNMVFDGCGVDPACAKAFPNLRSQFSALIDSARRRPRRVTIDGGVEVVVTDRVLAGALLSQLQTPFQFEVLPRTIDLIARGDDAALKSILSAGDDNQAWLMRLATWCNEEYPFEDKASIARQISDYPEFAGNDESTVPIGACEAAGFPATVDAREDLPVQIDAPVLVFSGAYDPITPPEWHRAMATRMPNASVVNFPAGGHGSGFYYDCAWKMLGAFVVDPAARSDACITDLRAPDFSRSTRRE